MFNERFYAELGSIFQKARQDAGLSQKDVADRLRLSRSCIANWEQGKRQITIDDVYRLCDLYGLDINDLTSMVRKYL